LTAALGGRAAEDVIFGDLSTNAASDLEFVTRTARDMVTRYGMSDQLGPITFGEKTELVFLGRELSEQRNYSERVARLIDEEVRNLVSESYHRARQVLVDHLDRLHAVAQRLLEVETLEAEEFAALVAGDGAAPARVAGATAPQPAAAAQAGAGT
jgi:cell division protease FtsH